MKSFQAAEAKLKADLDGLGALREPGKVSLESLKCLVICGLMFPPGREIQKLLIVACCFSIYPLYITFWFFSLQRQLNRVWCLGLLPLFVRRSLLFQDQAESAAMDALSLAQASLQARGMPGWRNRASTLAIWLEKRFPANSWLNLL